MVTPALLSLYHLRLAAKYREYERGPIFIPKCVRIAAKMTPLFLVVFSLKSMSECAKVTSMTYVEGHT